MTRRYDIGTEVLFEGSVWIVISFYFELRKLRQIGTDTYRTLTVERLDKENK